MAYNDLAEALDDIPETIDTWFTDPTEWLNTSWYDKWTLDERPLIERTIDIYEDIALNSDEFYSISIEFAPAATETTRAPHYE